MDGLRGLAAFIVVIFHFFAVYLPDLIPNERPGTLWVAYSPLAVLYNGRFYVWVFFVLSGFVVSNSAAKRKFPVVVNLVTRYLRLGLPVLASTLFAWLLLRMFPDTVHQMMLAGPHAFLTMSYNHNEPSFLAAVWHGLFGVFKTGLSLFNNPLWTMRIELIGSFGIYLIYGLTNGRLRLAVLILLGVALLFVHQNYLGFVFGALLRESIVADRLDRRWGWPALLIGALIGGEMLGWSDQGWLPVPSGLRHGESISIVLTTGAFLIVYATITLRWLGAFLESTVPRFIGKISFGLYLVHTPLLFTVFGQMYLAHVPLPVLLISFLATSVGLGYLFTLLIDGPTLHLIKYAQEKYGGLTNRTGMLEPTVQ